MNPVVTVAEMRAIDAASPDSEAVLIHRAGFAVARAALRMLGGAYGRRVVVIAGPGNNGADGRTAAAVLEVRGVRCAIFEPGQLRVVPQCDLVIDAAFGTGFHGDYKAPVVDGPVLAVDIPSGVNGDTGIACDGAVRATRTVTFAALKPGHFLADGPDHCGPIELCDIGLDTSSATMHLLEERDVRWALPEQQRESHKWKAAVAVVAGSPGMMGAAEFATQGAMRAGAGMVRLISPGAAASDLPVSEAVSVDATQGQWATTVFEAAERVHAIVMGPGLGRSDETGVQVRRVVAESTAPLVLDGDALFAIATDEGKASLRARRGPTVLTPHDGEFARLAGHAPGDDRVTAVRSLANDLQCIVLAKGSTTTIANSTGDVFFVNAGDARLATAGTGDVLSGITGAFLALGIEPHSAAAFAAYVHGAAAQNGYSHGLVAGDIPALVAAWLSNPRAVESYE